MPLPLLHHLAPLTHIAKTLGSPSIGHRSDTFASGRCLTDVDPKVFIIWIIGVSYLTMTVLKGCDSPDLFLETTNTREFKRGKNNSTTIRYIYNESAKFIKHMQLICSSMDLRFSLNTSCWHGRCGATRLSSYPGDYPTPRCGRTTEPVTMEKMLFAAKIHTVMSK